MHLGFGCLALGGKQMLNSTTSISQPLRMVEVVGCRDSTGKTVAEVMQMLGAWLMYTHDFIDLQHVEKVVVGLNYPLALERCREQAEKFSSGFVQTASTALGVSYATDQGVAVRINGEVLADVSAAQSTTIAADNARVVIHELCHGHDLGKRHSSVWRTAAHMPGNNVLLARLCEALWSEYFANRYSYFCSPSLESDWTRLEVLLDALPTLPHARAAHSTATTFGYVLGSRP